VKLKFEVDRALLSILEGLEKCGPAFKPNGVDVRRGKDGLRRDILSLFAILKMICSLRMS
jgi:hypothetical protein